MADSISLSSSAVPRGATVVGFRGEEALSRPYRVEIFLSISGGEDLHLREAIGAAARLSIDAHDGAAPPFCFAGILAGIELLHAHGESALFRLILVPRLFRLGLSRRSRVFTRMSFPAILALVLAENGLSSNDFELRLGVYEEEEHVCQYRESDLDFLSRWMEREGIFYYFDHDGDVEKVVFCDSHAYAADPLARPVRYVPEGGADVSAGPCLSAFTYLESTLPSAVKLKDYDYGHPSLDLSGSALVAPGGPWEVSLYGERFFTPAAGERLARLRAEELLARRSVAHAHGTRSHLRPGHVFELEEHPRAAFNARYLTIEAHHQGNHAAGNEALARRLGLDEDATYHVRLAAIPADVMFRPASKTPWPRIYGYENGFIDGEAKSDYAQIDEHGRYKVRISFDERALVAGGASTFIRMMQPHGGGVEGFHFPLRKGTEVVLSFLGGDPDRPVISGVVPNALTPSPVTGHNHTLNVIQTGGRNRIELEDQAGIERIRISTPYAGTYIAMGEQGDVEELTAYTDKDILIDARRNLTVNAGQGGAGDMTLLVKDAMTTTVERGNMETTVTTGDMLTTVTTGNMVTHVTTGDMETTVMTGTQSSEVEGLVTETYHDAQSTTVTTTRSLKADVIETTASTRSSRAVGGAPVSGALESISAAGWSNTLYSGGFMTLAMDGNLILNASKEVKITSRENDVFIEGGTVNITSRNETVTTNTGSRTEITFSDAISLALADTISLTVGATTEAFLGVQASVTVGASIEITGGFSLSIGGAVGFETTIAQIDAINNKIQAGATDFTVCGLKLIL
ncbi:MAG: type VI secretion system tip protein TssI/VgrG [Byssovorax sp.]